MSRTYRAKNQNRYHAAGINWFGWQSNYLQNLLEKGGPNDIFTRYWWKRFKDEEDIKQTIRELRGKAYSDINHGKTKRPYFKKVHKVGRAVVREEANRIMKLDDFEDADFNDSRYQNKRKSIMWEIW